MLTGFKFSGPSVSLTGVSLKVETLVLDNKKLACLLLALELGRFMTGSFWDAVLKGIAVTVLVVAIFASRRAKADAG